MKYIEHKQNIQNYLVLNDFLILSLQDYSKKKLKTDLLRRIIARWHPENVTVKRHIHGFLNPPRKTARYSSITQHCSINHHQKHQHNGHINRGAPPPPPSHLILRTHHPYPAQFTFNNKNNNLSL